MFAPKASANVIERQFHSHLGARIEVCFAYSLGISHPPHRHHTGNESADHRDRSAAQDRIGLPSPYRETDRPPPLTVHARRLHDERGAFTCKARDSISFTRRSARALSGRPRSESRRGSRPSSGHPSPRVPAPREWQGQSRTLTMTRRVSSGSGARPRSFGISHMSERDHTCGSDGNEVCPAYFHEEESRVAQTLWNDASDLVLTRRGGLLIRFASHASGRPILHLHTPTRTA